MTCCRRVRRMRGSVQRSLLIFRTQSWTFRHKLRSTATVTTNFVRRTASWPPSSRPSSSSMRRERRCVRGTGYTHTNTTPTPTHIYIFTNPHTPHHTLTDSNLGYNVVVLLLFTVVVLVLWTWYINLTTKLTNIFLIWNLFKSFIGIYVINEELTLVLYFRTDVNVYKSLPY